MVRRASSWFDGRVHGVAAGEADEPGILDRRLTVFDRLAIDRIADHFDEGGYRGIFRDEAMVPAFLGGPDQRQLEAAPPDVPAAEALRRCSGPRILDYSTGGSC